MSNPIRITIIGLGRIGTSIGLALKQTQMKLHIVGHDKEPAHTRAALKRKAIDKGDWNLPRSVEGADLVILALPFNAIAETMRYIAEDLRPNAVVMDTSPLKQPVLAWAQEHLPDHVHFVGGHPIVRDVQRGIDHARPDLFRREIFAICPPPNTPAKAVKLATDFVTALGAIPLFLDPGEHDSMMAAVEHLPQALALILAQTVIAAPSWREMRKLAGGQMEATTYVSSDSPEALADVLLHNREHVLTWLDMLTATAQEWRTLINEGAREELIARVEDILEARTDWLIAAQTGTWEEPPKTRGFSFVDWLFGQSLARRMRQGT